MKNFSILYFALITVVSSSCNEKFNKADWNSFNGGYYDKREPILDDLLTNHNLKGKSIKQLRALLGPYDLEVNKCNRGLVIQMNIVTDFEWNIDPQYTKDLFLYLNKDSIVTSFEVNERHV